MPRKASELNKPSELFETKIVWPIVLIGGCFGLIFSWTVLSGDSQGRVNLLYLLLVYLFIPLLSVVASLISLFFGKGINIARVISLFPLGSFANQLKIRKLQQLKLDKYWFLMQSQAAGIAYSLTSLIVFFLLLLATDINFVWRSTILSSTDLFPILKLIASPWSFWQSAQPSLELLQMTQNSRLLNSNVHVSIYGDWWQFILATQIFYSLLVRLIIYLVSVWKLNFYFAADIESQLQSAIESHPFIDSEKLVVSDLVHDLPKKIVINNWANIPNELLARLPSINVNAPQINSGPNATPVEKIEAERWQGEQLVIVKSWEPPLGELEDFLRNGKGYLFPIDWNELGLVNPSIKHVNEWRRFVNKLPNWQVYLPENLV